MGIFGRRKATPADGPDENAADLTVEAQTWIDRLAVPCVSIEIGPVTADPRTSYLSGFPYLPAGEQWPELGGHPALFVGQIDFAQVPALHDFPRSGLLQWFVAADDTLGLTFDDTAGAAGFTARWYADTSAPSQFPVDAATPVTGDDDLDSALHVDPGSELLFRSTSCLPAWDELDDTTRADEFWARYAAAVGEAEPWFGYEEHVRGASSPDATLARGSRIGGSANFVQDDPRGGNVGAYPPAGTPAATLLVELDSAQVGGWGDAGIGHLFGDPVAVGRGDLSSVRYHWDCG